MERISDRQLDIALRFALQDCFEEEIAEMDAIDPADYPVSEKTKRRFKRALDKSMRQKTWNLSIPRSLKKVAVVVLILATVLFTAMMAAPTVRAAVWDVIVKWYDQYIGVIFTRAENYPSTIEEVILPEGLPKEWEIETIISSIAMSEHSIKTKEGLVFFISQYVVDENELRFDNTYKEFRQVVLPNGTAASLYIYDDCFSIVWKNQYAFVINGELECLEAALLIAETMSK